MSSNHPASARGGGPPERTVVALLVCIFLALRIVWIQHPFWEDESFSALAATQDFQSILQLTRQDIHPPLYYWMLSAWNRLGLRVTARSDPGRAARLIRFDYHGKRWSARRPGGEIVAGVYGILPKDWAGFNLLPLAALRFFSVLLALLAALAVYGFIRLAAPHRPGIAGWGLLLIALSPYSIFWSTSIRNYCAYGMFLGAALPAGAWACRNAARTQRYWGGVLLCAALLLAALFTNYIALFYLPLFPLLPWLFQPVDDGARAGAGEMDKMAGAGGADAAVEGISAPVRADEAEKMEVVDEKEQGVGADEGGFARLERLPDPVARNWNGLLLAPAAALLIFGLLWGRTITGHLAYLEHDWFNLGALPGRAFTYFNFHAHFFWRVFFSFAPTQDLLADAVFQRRWAAAALLAALVVPFAAALGLTVRACFTGMYKRLALWLILAVNLPQALLILLNLARYESLPFFDRYFFPAHLLFCCLLGYGIDEFIRRRSSVDS